MQVNATPTDIPVGNQQAFTPSVEVAADGTVAVSYSDLRHNDPARPLLTDRSAPGFSSRWALWRRR